MGQHLQLYASDRITLEQAKEWCRYRAHDLIEMPTAAAEHVSDAMALGYKARVANFEHGSKTAVQAYKRLVWEAHIIDGALIDALAKDSREWNLRFLSLHHFLLQRFGWVVWGDNDGV